MDDTDKPAKKRCSMCENEKILDEFTKDSNRSDGRASACRKCRSGRYDKLYYSNYNKRNHWRRQASQKKWAEHAQGDVIDRYGGRCACCGEKRKQFLTLAPATQEARLRVKQVRTSIAYWLRKNEMPGGFKVTCQNCARAEKHWGRCPHLDEYEI